MSPQDEENERPPDRLWFTLLLFTSCLAGLVLQALSFGYLFQGLCDKVPDDRAYCKNSTNSTGMSDNGTADEPEGIPYYRRYQIFTGFALFTELLVVVNISLKIEYFVEQFFIPRCASVWESCVCCGNCWYIMAGITADRLDFLFNIPKKLLSRL